MRSMILAVGVSVVLAAGSASASCIARSLCVCDAPWVAEVEVKGAGPDTFGNPLGCTTPAVTYLLEVKEVWNVGTPPALGTIVELPGCDGARQIGNRFIYYPDLWSPQPDATTVRCNFGDAVPTAEARSWAESGMCVAKLEERFGPPPPCNDTGCGCSSSAALWSSLALLAWLRSETCRSRRRVR